MIEQRTNVIAGGSSRRAKYLARRVLLGGGAGLLMFALVTWNTAGCSALPLPATPSATLAATPTRALSGLGMIAFVVSGGHPPSAIYKMGGDGTWITRLTRDVGDSGHPTWSRDGQQIAFVSWRDGSPALYIMSEIGDNVHRLPGPNITDGKLTWSPDDKQIAYTGGTDDAKTDIWVIDLEDLQVTRLTKEPGWDEDPAWSPDGSQIAFGSTRDGDYEVYVMNKDGNHIRKLTHEPRGCHGPDWSPDGRRIAFACNTGSGPVIHTMNADGSQDVLLMNPGAYQSGDYPSWSPDGQRIAFQSASLGFNDIYVMDADGSNILRLTNLEPFGMDAREPAWQPIFR